MSLTSGVPCRTVLEGNIQGPGWLKLKKNTFVCNRYTDTGRQFALASHSPEQYHRLVFIESL